ncbi:MAG: U32 family peptidase [Clostridia bacterium]|nr:U32 family peptidase [Clostridia bacterium]
MHELLAPAGSPDALVAAVDAGADAIYLGGNTHNARLAGDNFSNDALREAVLFCHARHVKVYLTLNTLLTDRELAEMPAYAAFLADLGIDGVIIQDLGLARLLRQCVPALPLHASTQMTVHNSEGIARAAALGFRRVVLSRESFDRDMLCHAPIETEVFIHGALCVSYSGQCYFSSMLSRRSGNRGMCAQPCRHIYKNGYELSLHDLCLAKHIPSLLSLPIASFKIEGRLKSPSYVAGVVSVYRKLIDENRAATAQEMDFLAQLFSRQGFTDGYYIESPGPKMFGYRTEADKRRTAALSVSAPAPKKIPLSMDLQLSAHTPASLQLNDGKTTVCVTGDIPEAAQTHALSPADCEKQLKKLGNSPYLPKITCRTEPSLFLSTSSLNALRRKGLAALEEAQTPHYAYTPWNTPIQSMPVSKQKTYCIFQSAAQIPADLAADMVWLPLFAVNEKIPFPCGVVLPTVFFDNETAAVREKLIAVREMNITAVLCQTIGQSQLCRSLGMQPYGGIGLNIMNAHAASMADVTEVMLSPELMLSQIVSMPKPYPVNVMVYGRQTLMTMENCLAKNQHACTNRKAYYPLTDRKGNVFPVLCAYKHRNEILNAHPLYMLDKLSKLQKANINAFVLRFTTENKAQICDIMDKYRKELPADFPFTRGSYFQKEAKIPEK